MLFTIDEEPVIFKQDWRLLQETGNVLPTVGAIKRLKKQAQGYGEMSEHLKLFFSTALDIRLLKDCPSRK